MVKYESNCVGCHGIGLHCIGSGCDNYKDVKVFYCDDCGDEVERGELYEFDGEQLCIDCIKNRLEPVK